MKRSILAIVSVSLLLFIGAWKEKTANAGAEVKQNSSGSIKTTAIDGAWELVSVEVNGKLTKPIRPSQIKLFTHGYFSYLMQDDTGKWSNAGAGTFELLPDNKTYQEKHLYNSTPAYIGATDWQEYEMKGDTLVSKLFTKVIMADGKDVTANFPKSIEKRVRAKA